VTSSAGTLKTRKKNNKVKAGKKCEVQEVKFFAARAGWPRHTSMCECLNDVDDADDQKIPEICWSPSQKKYPDYLKQQQPKTQ